MACDIQDRKARSMKQYYRYIGVKLKSKMHLCDENGVTVCRAEFGSKRMDVITDEPTSGRQICGICQHLQKQGKKARRKTKNRQYADLFLNTWEWRQVRYMALKRSKGHCEACGRSPDDAAVLNVDHIKPRRKHPELALSLENLQVLCSWCNQGKGNWDQTDWREPSLAVLMGEKMK